LIHNTKSDEGEEIEGDPRQEVWSGQKKIKREETRFSACSSEQQQQENGKGLTSALVQEECSLSIQVAQHFCTNGKAIITLFLALALALAVSPSSPSRAREEATPAGTGEAEAERAQGEAVGVGGTSWRGDRHKRYMPGFR
jgi:hypothetical protein